MGLVGVKLRSGLPPAHTSLDRWTVSPPFMTRALPTYRPFDRDPSGGKTCAGLARHIRIHAHAKSKVATDSTCSRNCNRTFIHAHAQVFCGLGTRLTFGRGFRSISDITVYVPYASTSQTVLERPGRFDSNAKVSSPAHRSRFTRAPKSILGVALQLQVTVTQLVTPHSHDPTGPFATAQAIWHKALKLNQLRATWLGAARRIH